MRAVWTSVLILVSACSLERPTAPPQPQKSALTGCYLAGHYPPTRTCHKPLILVDGKELVDDTVDLNPGEIESVDVLKGELALKQYGEAARNGVVVIRTKKAAGNRD